MKLGPNSVIQCVTQFIASLSACCTSMGGVCFIALVLCKNASAAVLDTYPDWDGNVTESYLKIAQSFIAPTNNILSSWKFGIAPGAVSTNLIFEVVLWNAMSGPVGEPLFSRVADWPKQGGDIELDQINLGLSPGSRYAAIVDLRGYAGPSVHFEFNQDSYKQGNAAWYAGVNPSWKYLDSTYNTEFRAEFFGVPEPGGLLALGLAAIGLLRLRYDKIDSR
jgi:hypothetical protein